MTSFEYSVITLLLLILILLIWICIKLLPPLCYIATLLVPRTTGNDCYKHGGLKQQIRIVSQFYRKVLIQYPEPKQAASKIAFSPGVMKVINPLLLPASDRHIHSVACGYISPTPILAICLHGNSCLFPHLQFSHCHILVNYMISFRVQPDNPGYTTCAKILSHVNS